MTVISDTQHSTAPKQSATIHLAAIGLGQRATRIMQMLSKLNENAQLSVLVDPDEKKLQQCKEDKDIRTAEHIAWYDDVDQMIAAGPQLDGIVVGTRCHLHTPIAVKLSALNLPLFLEKPVCISWDQYRQLEKTFANHDENVVISFPLRNTPLVKAVRQYITDGRLGTINQIQAVNNVSYGNVYVDTWYRDYELNGGLWLQKATHDFDYVHYLADATPLCITAMHSRCVWPDDVLHQDAGSAIVQYDSGIHANYTQNFITRQQAGMRGATITGEDGSIRFDWSTDSFIFHAHKQKRVENVSIKADNEGHGGGDHKLIGNFLDIILKRDVSQTTLREGLLSAATCLAARDAANLYKVVAIPQPFSDAKPQPLAQRIEPLD